MTTTSSTYHKCPKRRTSYLVLSTPNAVPSTKYVARSVFFILCLVLSSLLCTTCAAHSAESRCCSCGCAAPCQKVCRLECGEKKVEIICWGCKKEDFCIPCKSEQGFEHCQAVCENCGEDADPKVCSKPKNFVWFDWMPGTAKIHTKTKLMKKIETVTVPSYKWVAEDMCPQCAANAAAAQPGTIVYAPSAPATATPAPAKEEESVFNIVRRPSFLKK